MNEMNKTILNQFETLLNESESLTKDCAKIYVLSKIVSEFCESLVDDVKPILENYEPQDIKFPEYAKMLSVSISKSTSIDKKINDELTIEELRTLYKPTESGLKTIGKSDLLTKYKTITEKKSVKIGKLKD